MSPGARGFSFNHKESKGYHKGHQGEL